MFLCCTFLFQCLDLTFNEKIHLFLSKYTIKKGMGEERKTNTSISQGKGAHIQFLFLSEETSIFLTPSPCLPKRD